MLNSVGRRVWTLAPRRIPGTVPPYSLQCPLWQAPLNYGPSDYNVGKAFKLYGMWQPVLFHASKNWAEKIVGGWTLSGIFNWHSGFPWDPYASVVGGSLYCGSCGYTNLPALYLGGAGNSTSNHQFKTGSNFPLVATQGNALGGAAWLRQRQPTSPTTGSNRKRPNPPRALSASAATSSPAPDTGTSI